MLNIWQESHMSKLHGLFIAAFMMEFIFDDPTYTSFLYKIDHDNNVFHST